LAFYAKVWYDFLVIKKERLTAISLSATTELYRIHAATTQIHCSMNFIENPNLLLIFFTLSIKKSP